LPRALENLLKQLSSPAGFYALGGRLIPWLGGACALVLAVGLYWGLVIAPADYQQGESYRIMFVHVPSAWMSLFVYVVMALAGAVGLIWRIKTAEVIAVSSAPIGAMFTFLALVTGSLWGKPMWGTWWVWDARLTSELLLLFLYLGAIALHEAIEDKRAAAKALALLSVVGVVNIPVIHYSVEWWNTLHQPSTMLKAGGPAIDARMLAPLLLMAVAFKLYYAMVLLLRCRCTLVSRERNSRWVAALREAR
jgi:heme exporter protein C